MFKDALAFALDRPLSGGDLSKRESQVLSLLSRGLTNQQIGLTLDISPHTIKTHVDHIFNKLGVENRIQAAVWAAKNDFV